MDMRDLDEEFVKNCQCDILLVSPKGDTELFENCQLPSVPIHESGRFVCFWHDGEYNILNTDMVAGISMVPKEKKEGDDHSS